MQKIKDIGCGPGWLTFGKWDYFYDCCKEHDKDYILSEALYAKAYIEDDQEGMFNALNMKQGSDVDFTACVRVKAKERFILLRPLTIIRGELYISLVLRHSNDLWFNGVRDLVSRQEEIEAILQMANAEEMACGSKGPCLWRTISDTL